VTYELLYTQRAVKDIKKLDPVVRKHLKQALEKFQQRPFFYAKKLTSLKIGQYRWRIGNYRIVFDIDKEKLIIFRVGHRREIYE